MSWRLPRTTFGLAALVSVLLCALSIVTGLAARSAAHEELERHLDRRIEDETQLLLKELAAGGLPALVAALEKRTGQHTANGMGYLLAHTDGVRIAGELRTKLPRSGWQEFVLIDHETRPYTAQALTTSLPGGMKLVVAADRTPIAEMDDTIGQVTLGTSVAMLILGIGGAWLLGLTVRRRIDGITQVAHAITEGHLDRRMPRDHRSGEFDRLAATLNRMLDRNTELLGNLRQVSNDIAHDLRTPLGRQQQLFELALAECTDVAGYRQAIEKARLAGEEMLQIFAALLKISEIESFSLRSSFVRVDVREVAERVVEAFRPDAEAGGRSLHARLCEHASVSGNPHLLSQLLVNLIENAMRHTPRGTRIEVALESQDSFLDLIVADNGTGIDPKDRTQVLDRFVRLERSRSTQGHGLGLSLVKAIADAHQAEVHLEDAQPGLRVRVRFLAEDRKTPGTYSS
jgi:signal transduction histidine kinase